MKNKINEFESVIAFVIYIAKQDKKFSSLEKNELLADLPLIKKLYFDEYGEFIKSEAIEQISSIEKKLNVFKRGRKSKFRSLLLNNNFEPAKNLSLEELTEKTCKYMEGHPDEKTSSFCGRKTVEKYSYCPLHMLTVWQTRDKKEELLEKEDEVPQFIEKKIKSA